MTLCKVCNKKTEGKNRVCKHCENKICIKYTTSLKSAGVIGNEYNISHTTVIKILKRNGYSIRNLSGGGWPKGKKRGPQTEKHKDHRRISMLGKNKGQKRSKEFCELMHKLNSGPNHPQYIDGESYKYVMRRQFILLRDNCQCQDCYINEYEHKLKHKRGFGLVIHHIDGDHNNNTLNNQITLCQSCHVKRHRSRGT